MIVLRHGSVVEIVPLSLATAASVLRLGLAVGFVIVFSLNVAFRRAFVSRTGFRNGDFSLVVFVAKNNNNKRKNCIRKVSQKG